MTDHPREAAIEELTEFGLSTYAARTFVGLVRLGSGTAWDMSRVVDVPRPRVYDAAEELHDAELVDVTRSSPRRFAPVSAETAGRSFERELRRRTDRLRGALDALEPADSRTEQCGVWTAEGRDAVTDRVIEFFAGADEEIVYMTVEELLADEVVEALGDASDRGVEIQLGGVSPAVGSSIRETIPTAETFESLWVWSDTPAERLLMIDRERVLVGVVLEDSDGQPAETAIWGVGETNGLVVVLKIVFT